MQISIISELKPHQANIDICILSTTKRLTRGDKPLRGVHLRVIPLPNPGVLDVSFDANGNLTKETGRAYFLMEWLSLHLGFTYSYLEPKKWPKSFTNTTKGRGATNYLNNREADVTLSAVLMTEDRLKECDMPYPWGSSYFSIMIPTSSSSANIGGPWKPFKLSVWILLAASVIVVPLTLFLFNSISNRTHRQGVQRQYYFGNLEKAVDYVLTVLFSQGGVCYPQRIYYRLVAGVWCLATMVLVNSYCCTLISFIASPNNQPLINSIYDIPNTPGVNVVLEEGKAADQIFFNGDRGIIKYIGDQLKRNPMNRCRDIQDCFMKVKTGHYVYFAPMDGIPFYIDQDFKSTGRCNLAIAKEGFMNNLLFSIGLPKNSPYTDLFSQGIIQLRDTGLLEIWRDWNLPHSGPCFNKNQANRTLLRLSMKNLSSAFIFLTVGLLAALVVFCFERIAYHRHLKNQKQFQ